jgi:hypothetical protein
LYTPLKISSVPRPASTSRGSARFSANEPAVGPSRVCDQGAIARASSTVVLERRFDALERGLAAGFRIRSWGLLMAS